MDLGIVDTLPQLNATGRDGASVEFQAGARGSQFDPVPPGLSDHQQCGADVVESGEVESPSESLLDLWSPEIGRGGRSQVDEPAAAASRESSSFSRLRACLVRAFSSGSSAYSGAARTRNDNRAGFSRDMTWLCMAWVGCLVLIIPASDPVEYWRQLASADC